MKANKILLLALALAGSCNAVVLKHPKMHMLDNLVAQSPFMLDEIVKMKKAINKSQADVAAFITVGT